MQNGVLQLFSKAAQLIQLWVISTLLQPLSSRRQCTTHLTTKSHMYLHILNKKVMLSLNLIATKYRLFLLQGWHRFLNSCTFTFNLGKTLRFNQAYDTYNKKVYYITVLKLYRWLMDIVRLDLNIITNDVPLANALSNEEPHQDLSANQCVQPGFL